MAYNTPDTIYYRTTIRLKRQAAQLIEDAKKAEASLVFSGDRMGKTLEAGELEPIEGWGYSFDPWPGRAIREMSPLSEISEDDIKHLEAELVSERLDLDTVTRSSPGQSHTSRGRTSHKRRRR
jgi:hypothetical protein